MAKLATNPISETDLGEYLRSNDDFAFEREIVHAATTLNLNQVEHSGLYEDSLQRKQRQFDIRASHTQGDCRIELAIECKRLSPSFPLLVSCVPRAQNEAFHQYLHTFERAQGGNLYVNPESVRSGGPMSLYPSGLLVGKSMRQVGRESNGKSFIATDSEVFDKWAQALASIAERLERYAPALGPRRPFVPKVAFVPVLVVPDGTLWGAKYTVSGAIWGDPSKEPEVTFYVGRKYPLGTGVEQELMVTHLHICTRSAVDQFLHGIAYGGGIWQQLFGP